MTAAPILRVARPSDNLDDLLRFYEQGLGLAVLDRFADHDGFDGVMLGKAGAPYHFEFTRAHGHPAGRAPTEDNLLVFHLPDPGEWKPPFNACKGPVSSRSRPSTRTGIVKA
jgi:catechol 2,3-dioxygenase-like lactoylglutathione lyase family enzyme